MTCSHCGGHLSPERAEIKSVCMKSDCVTAGLAEQRSRMSLVLMHKVGYVPRFIGDDVRTNKNA